MPLTVTLVAVLIVAAAMVAIGAFATAWRRDAMSALAGIPLMFGGAGVALVGVTRFAARANAAVESPAPIVVRVSGPPLGQEFAILVAVVALVLVVLGIAITARAGRAEAPR